MYLALIRERAECAKVRVLTDCLMTNHVHPVVVLEQEEFVEQMEERLQRVWRRWGFEKMAAAG